MHVYVGSRDNNPGTYVVARLWDIPDSVRVLQHGGDGLGSKMIEVQVMSGCALPPTTTPETTAVEWGIWRIEVSEATIG